MLIPNSPQAEQFEEIDNYQGHFTMDEHFSLEDVTELSNFDESILTSHSIRLGSNSATIDISPGQLV